MFTRNALCVGLLVSLITGTVHAANDKQPWEWTTAERLKARFDPDQIKERRDAYTRKLGPKANAYDAAGGDNWQPGTITYTIDGARNPELFLPHELFDGVLKTLIVGDEAHKARQRGFYRPLLENLGYDDTFWERMKVIGREYLEIYAVEAPPDGHAERGRELCRARHKALQRSREVFGRWEFDVILYTVFARTTDSSHTTNFRDPIAELLVKEEGCN